MGKTVELQCHRTGPQTGSKNRIPGHFPQENLWTASIWRREHAYSRRKRRGCSYGRLRARWPFPNLRIADRTQTMRAVIQSIAFRASIRI